MIYACHRHAIPPDHPEGSACIMPALCEICGEREPYAGFADVWFCTACTRPFLLGIRIGVVIESAEAIKRSREARS